jgi:hypothetical protein
MARTDAPDRQLLEELRQDPAPKAVSSNPWSPQSTIAPQRPPRRPDPFARLRMAGYRISAWLQSLGR